MTITLAPAHRTSRRRQTRQWAHALGALFIVMMSVVSGASTASAHTDVTKSLPADGSTQATAPGKISVFFNEQVTQGTDLMRVIASDGSVVPAEISIDGAADGSSSVNAVPTSKLANGWYAVRWEVIAEDGHPKIGTFTFLVGQDRSGSAAKVDDPTAPFRKATDPLRLLGYLTTLLAVGLLIASWAMSGLPSHRTTVNAAGFAAGAGLVTAPLTLLNYALLLNGGSFTDIGAVFSIALQSSSGTALLVRTSALFALCTGVLLASERAMRWVAAAAGLIGAVGLAVSYSLSGHTTVVPLSKIAGPLLVVHLVAAAAWLGGLPALAAVFLKRSTLDDTQILRATKRFSLIATISVIVVGLAGTALAVTMFTKPSEVFSRYGFLLAVKIAAVALFALMGAYNHFIGVPALEREATNASVAQNEASSQDAADSEAAVSSVDTSVEGDRVTAPSAARLRLRRILRVEAIGVIAISLATAVLTTTGAPAAGSNHGLDDSHGHNGSVNLSTAIAPLRAQGTIGDKGVDITLTPGEPGVLATLTVKLTDAVGGKANAEDVRVELTNAVIGAPIERELTRNDDGTFSIETRDFGIPGIWQVKVIAEFDALSSAEATLDLNLPGRVSDSVDSLTLTRTPSSTDTTTTTEGK